MVEEEKKEEGLFESKEQTITADDFTTILKDLRIESGDTLFVHSDITSFGTLATRDRNYLLNSLVDSIKHSVGNTGTVIMPTFTYSSDKGEAFSATDTKSTVGTLTEYFRKLDGIIRTKHPTHSAAVWGKHRDDVISIGKNTFDEESIFGKFHALNGKLVFFGTPFHKACTFIHYIEKKCGVPYRYTKKYTADLIEGNKAWKETMHSYYKYSFFFTDMTKLEEHLKQKGLLVEKKIGDGFVQVVNSVDLLKEVSSLLEKDTFYVVRNDSYFKIFNTVMLPFLKFIPFLVKLLDMIAGPILRR